MAKEHVSREEAVQFLTMQRDLLAEAVATSDAPKVLNILEQTGDRIGYTPAFRCLVMGMEPENAIRWGQ